MCKGCSKYYVRYTVRRTGTLPSREIESNSRETEIPTKVTIS